MNAKATLHLEDWGLQNISLREYQLEGVQWYINCVKNGHGGVLADEMGLGKTIQTISAIISFKKLFNFHKFIVISPLSVIHNWQTELSQFAPNLKFIVYMGDKGRRSDISSTKEWHSEDVVLLTTYEYVIQDYDLIGTLKLDVLFMDEGHRIKNSKSVLYNKVTEMVVKYRFLLTGTPIQNNLDELYNILYVVSPRHSMLSSRAVFKRNMNSKLAAASSGATFDSILEIDRDLSGLILRRTKANVLQHLPEKLEVLIFHGLTSLQKKLYKSFLSRSGGVLKGAESDDESEPISISSNHKKLLNTLMQIRKCVLHPYLFSGIEPEPFQLGEHIVDNSDKMQTIDKLLKYLIPLGHKILLFSQMTKMLDIIQDYCSLRKFEYERLDGSVRSEERFAAIAKFSSSSTTKLFLLSTRAGGQGLNLTAADTVIFVDSDFNPQVDLQAMARIHRPGQERPCRTIRLVARHSVEEMIISRAQQKLVMTRSILGHEDSSKDNGGKMNVKEMLCYGLDQLFSDETPISSSTSTSFSHAFFTSILGGTNPNGHWQSPEGQTQTGTSEHAYLVEGRDYLASTSDKDYRAAASLVGTSEDPVPSKTVSKVTSVPKMVKDRATVAMERKMRAWAESGYRSGALPVESDEDGEETVEDAPGINYVIGDVTAPLGEAGSARIVCHMIDDSGMWGSGGVFSSIDRINTDISVSYLMAKEMDDLSLGDCHIFQLTSDIEIALLVAQSRDKNDRLSSVRMNSLEMSIKKLKSYAAKKNASVHLPRLGYKTPQFNWYGVERLLAKNLAEKGIQTYVYYYPRNNKRSRQSSGSSHIENNKIRKVEKPVITVKKLSEEFFDSCLSDVVVFFDETVSDNTKKELTRHIYTLHGEVAPSPLDDSITHHLVDRTISLNTTKTSSPVASCGLQVDLQWLLESIRLRSKLPEAAFAC